MFIGRPALWGLAYGGEEGVKKILSILKKEFDFALALTGDSIKWIHLIISNFIRFDSIAGCRNPQDITKSMVVHESYYSKL